ncbi:MAG: class I SAM-dependent methyltransferase [Pseudomonadota bacterium]
MSVLAETFDVVVAGVPTPLISDQALARLKASARGLPQILAGGLECRLASGSNAQVDLQLCITRGSPDVEVLQAFLKQHQNDAAVDDPWQRLATLVAAWVDPASALNEQIAEIWLEFDCAGDHLSPPSVFLGLQQSPRPADVQRPAIDAALEILLSVEAWDKCRAMVHCCFDSCVGDVFVSHLGVMLGRRVDAVRVNVKRLDDTSIGSFLSMVGWHGPAGAVTDLTKLALTAVDRVTLCLDVGAEVAEAFGLECIHAPDRAGRDRWQRSIQDLSNLAEMDADKCSALPQWHRLLMPGSALRTWPRQLIAATLYPGTNVKSQIDCRISHLKLSVVVGSVATAKAYLAFKHIWAENEPAGVAKIDEFYSDDDISLWKQVLGPDLHFHFGLFHGTEDLQTGLAQTVRSYFPHIRRGSKVLDLGCGWGGPAKVLTAEHDCQVTGITISEVQAAHCQTAGLNVHLLDLDDPAAEPSQGYDILFSLEMISHIRDKAGFLRRARSCGSKLILSESCAADDYEGPRTTFGGSMQLCTVSELTKAVEQAGWTIKSLSNRRSQSMRTLELWDQNLKRTFGGTPPAGAFGAMHSMIVNAGRDPIGWADSFPLIDIVAD